MNKIERKAYFIVAPLILLASIIFLLFVRPPMMIGLIVCLTSYLLAVVPTLILLDRLSSKPSIFYIFAGTLAAFVGSMAIYSTIIHGATLKSGDQFLIISGHLTSAGWIDLFKNGVMNAAGVWIAMLLASFASSRIFNPIRMHRG